MSHVRRNAEPGMLADATRLLNGWVDLEELSRDFLKPLSETALFAL
jgi:hypothetical protein